MKLKKTIRHYSGAKWPAIFDGEKVTILLDDGAVDYSLKEVATCLFTGTWEIVAD